MSTITKSVGAFDAKTHLSQYLDEVEKGESIQITRRGKPVAVLVSMDEHASRNTEITEIIERVKSRKIKKKVTVEEIIQWKNAGRP